MKRKKEAAAPAKKDWQKPELARLGTMRDIAGPSSSGGQAGPNSRS